jgi:methylated-DNA-[protein]-cysteine S-methyltransferase
VNPFFVSEQAVIKMKKFHMILHTEFGEVVIIFRKHPFLLIKILLPIKNRKDLALALKREHAETSSSIQEAQIIAGPLKKYFKGKPPEPSFKPPWNHMNLEGLTFLQKAVLVATEDIEYGTVKSYKEIAEITGRPGACRFVGNTLARNPFPILIPCHRVIRSNGTYGQFGGGTDMKKALIRFESHKKN